VIYKRMRMIYNSAFLGELAELGIVLLFHAVLALLLDWFQPRCLLCSG